MTREELIDFSFYVVYENGDIFSKTLKRNLTTPVNENGYVRNSLKCKDGEIRPFYRERAIYFYFKGKIDEELEIDHINGIKTDNSINNLRAVTNLENVHNEITFEKWKKLNVPPIHNKPHTLESKRKMSEKLKGRKLSEEHRKKLSERFSGENNPMYGKHHKPETILKRSNEVYVFSKSMELIGYYISINECEKNGYSHVSEKCKHKRNDHNGFTFMFKDEYLKMVEEGALS